MDKRGSVSFVDDVNKLQSIKCVVVGDRAVGKSHLVCAKACGTKYHLRDLIQTHVSTIWAVDHYRTNLDIRLRSVCTVECVTCSLRLWDTFGNHEKDRQFAYSSADVILLCFSVSNRRSLKHVETHWMPEIFRNCGHIPIVLCACQVDMRYLCHDPVYQGLAREASQRRILPEDIVLPAEAKEMANKFGLYYYESSVLVQYGIDEVFSNCVRAALISKRRGKILVGLGNLKNVVRPHLQVPHMPPRPPPPKVFPYSREDREDRSDAVLLGDRFFSDVVFVVQGQRMEGHGVQLAAASAVFHGFLEEAFCVNRTRSALGFSSFASGSQETLKDRSLEYEMRNFGLSVDDEGDDSSDHDTGISEGDSRGCSWRCLLSQDSNDLSVDDSSSSRHHPRHRSVSARQYQPQQQSSTLSATCSVSTGTLSDCDELGTDTDRDSGLVTRTPTISSSSLSAVMSFQSVELVDALERLVIVVDESVSPAQFQMVMRYLYTGELQEDLSLVVLLDLKRVALLLGLENLERQIQNVLNSEPFLNLELRRRFREEKSDRLYMLLHGLNFLSDVTFELDDGRLYGNRAILSARSDVLSTMFKAEFSERSTGHASFPGVTRDAFLGVMEYLYTGRCPTTCKDWIGLIELSDRFFLRDLLLSAEIVIIKELGATLESAGAEVVDLALAMITPAKLHGANQLVAYCAWILKVNYKDLIESDAGVFDAFDETLKGELARDRWPPVWYLDEVEIYEKAMREMNKMRPQPSWLRRTEEETCISPGSCLSFWKRKK